MVKNTTKKQKYSTGVKKYSNYKLELSKLPTYGLHKYGTATPVNKTIFPVLNTFTSYYVEIFDESMRCVHIHDSDEVGYVAEGQIEVFIWESETVYTKTLIEQGNSWFIPKGALHSLNNVGEKYAKLYVAFNSPHPSNTDIAILLNGLPKYLKNEYAVSPHSILKNYVGPNTNYFFNDYPKDELDIKVSKSSPFSFNINDTKPEFYDNNVGFIKKIDKKKWPILEGTNFSLGKFVLKPRVSTDSFWYKNNDALYIVYNGNADIYMSMSGFNNTNDKNKISIKSHEYYFVPKGTPHTIRNSSNNSNLEMIVYYSDDIIEHVSLGPSLLFFGEGIIQDSFITNKLVQAKKSKSKTIKNIKRLIKI